MPTTMNSPIPWYGGKHYMKKEILGFFSEHDSYVEPFFGGGSIFFAKRKSRLETINDLDGEVVNFFRICRDDSSKLVRLSELTPYSREFYNENLKIIKSGKVKDPVEKAWRFFETIRQGFGGSIGCGWSYSKNTNEPRKKINATKRIFDIAERLRDALIENKPAIEVIKFYCQDTSLCYCDPPYMQETRKTFNDYTKEMSRDDHVELLDVLVKTKGKVILSHYENDLYDKKLLPHGWEKNFVDVACHVRKSQYEGEKKEERKEVIWLNPKAYKGVVKQENLFE